MPAKKNKYTDQDATNCIEKKYSIHDGPIVTSQKHPAYINNYYKGQCCLERGNEEEVLKYFQLCHVDEPDYIFTRAPFCYEFFNRHLKQPRQLEKVVQ